MTSVSSATKRSTKKAKATAGERFTAYKGFDKDLICNPAGKPFQYEIGKTYTTDTAIVRCAGGGFHSCENPLDVFGYYAPATSRYCEVEIGGKIARDDDDTKIASAEITIKAELKIPDMVDRAVKWILAHIEDSKKESNTGNWSAATNTGNQSAATNTGDQSAATNTGDRSAAEVSGKESVAASLGYAGRARAGEGGAIVLCHRDSKYRIIHIRASKVGENGIKADVWYSLDANGEFVEA